MGYLSACALQVGMIFDDFLELLLICAISLNEQDVPACCQRFLKTGEMNIRGLHTNKAGLPGYESKSNDRQKYKGHPTNLRRDPG